MVGPNKYVGEKNIGTIRALLSFVYIGWRMLSSKILLKPNYIFTGPMSPDFLGINELFVNSGCKPIIDSSFPLTVNAMSRAINHVASHRASGKVVINIGEGE